MMVITQSGAPESWSERDLEDYLEAHMSLPGQDLMIIGRQVRTTGGIIDLLAIDSTGVVYIIELKLKAALYSVINQVLGYRRSIKRWNRENIIRVVRDGQLNIDLVDSFRRHFGRPLPETVNESQVLVIIAASIHPQTAYGILELLDQGCSVLTFRYVRRSNIVSLISCCRNDEDVEGVRHALTKPSAPPNHINERRKSTIGYPVNENIRRFWSVHVQDFAPFVTFSFIFERYQDWVETQPAIGVRLRNMGMVARNVYAIITESREWTRVFVAHGSDMQAYNTVMVPPSVRTYWTQGHRVVAYQRNPIDPA